METIDRKSISSISHFLEKVIHQALDLSASDIHIDPRSEYVDIYVRCFGSMQLLHRMHTDLHEEFVGRIKIVSKLRTDVHERGQDGRFVFLNGKEHIDIRVSILPTFFGENAVLRILRPEYRKELTFESLGMFVEQGILISNALKLNQGIILVVGPTGSGKTTTLYSMIQELSCTKKNIITIEDPIEYIIPHARQIQVSDSNGFTFGSALRSVVRQDPDVLVIGEMRDAETSRLAFQASLTGHLVITSLHAEDCASVYSRLIDLGIQDHSLGSIKLIISQRLLAHKAEGHTKRTGIFEVVCMNPEIRDVVYSKSFPEHIRMRLLKLGVCLLGVSLTKKKDEGYKFLDDHNIPHYE